METPLDVALRLAARPEGVTPEQLALETLLPIQNAEATLVVLRRYGKIVERDGVGYLPVDVEKEDYLQPKELTVTHVMRLAAYPEGLTPNQLSDLYGVHPKVCRELLEGLVERGELEQDGHVYRNVPTSAVAG